MMEYSFCPKCGGKLALKSLKASEPSRLVCSECLFVFFLNPKVAAGALFTLNGRVVMLRRSIEPCFGKWVFPGGYVDRGETVMDAAIRETREEVNLEIRIVSLLNVYSYTNSPVIVVVYTAEIVGGEIRAGDEALEARAFSPEEIPWSELAFPSTFEALRSYLRSNLRTEPDLSKFPSDYS
jgi:ADP-ribose pyrophosphatase YjhB (NUDIX family)